VVSNLNGAVGAFFDTYRHRAQICSEKDGHAIWMVCAYHHGSYELQSPGWTPPRGNRRPNPSTAVRNPISPSPYDRCARHAAPAHAYKGYVVLFCSRERAALVRPTSQATAHEDLRKVCRLYSAPSV
jgi:hypothetical protein